MPVASLTRVTFTFARMAPVGSATRPRMRPLAPWAKSNVGIRREIAATRQTVSRHIVVQRARSDGMEPPGTFRRYLFFLKATACVQAQPCYNPARLEKRCAHCQGEKKRCLP